MRLICQLLLGLATFPTDTLSDPPHELITPVPKSRIPHRFEGHERQLTSLSDPVPSRG